MANSINKFDFLDPLYSAIAEMRTDMRGDGIKDKFDYLTLHPEMYCDLLSLQNPNDFEFMNPFGQTLFGYPYKQSARVSEGEIWFWKNGPIGVAPTLVRKVKLK